MTTPQDDLLREAAALAPGAVLQALADVVGSDEQPMVAVFLSGGHVLHGMPVRIGADHGQDVLVLADPRGGQLNYVLLAAVVAVQVRAPERYRDVLTEGRLAPPVTGAPVSLLALRREFAPSPEFQLGVNWDAVPDSGPALANLDRLLRALRDIVDEVRADELGRQAWALIRTVTVIHRSDMRMSVERMQDTLVVWADLSAALPRDLAGELRRQLNALL